VRVSERASDRITELSYQLDLSKVATVDMLIDTFDGKMSQAEYAALLKPNRTVKALKGKKLQGRVRK